jgi:hypothetical protein
MQYKASFCDPFKADIVDLGYVEKEKVMELFERVPWAEYLVKMEAARENEIHWSPSLDFKDEDNHQIISVSVAGKPDNIDWLIFYIRPKKVKRLFGLLGEKMNNEHMTEVQGRTETDARNAIEALLRGDYAWLDEHIS